MNHTPRFGFTTLDTQTDQIDGADNKFGGADRVLLDQLLSYVVEHHVHTGVRLAQTPPPAPMVTTFTSGGILPANATIYYKYAIVDGRGQIEMASAMAIVHTPPQVPTPGPPIEMVPVAGGLVGGNYAYAISAYTAVISQETLLSATTANTLPGGGGWRLKLPALPSGATGFNIYRRGPGDDELIYLDSISSAWLNISYIDNGAVAADVRHGVPTMNTTCSSNSVQIDLPFPPNTPVTARIYRTTNPTQWSTSLVDWVDYTPFVDTGHGTRRGVPPLSSSGVGGAPKINLNDLAEVDGSIPAGMTDIMTQAMFTFAGPVEPGYGMWMWINEFDRCELVSMRCTLGVGSVPAGQEVIVKLQRHRVGGTWEDILLGYYTDNNNATIAVGDTVGDIQELPYWMLDGVDLQPGDAIRPVILQSGGGATPTDRDLSVIVNLIVRHGPDNAAYTWETS